MSLFHPEAIDIARANARRCAKKRRAETLRAERDAAGLCVQCGERARRNYVTCGRCGERDRMRKKRKAKR